MGIVLTTFLPSHAVPAGVAKIQMIAFSYNGSERELKISNAQGSSMTDKPVNLPINQCSPPFSVSSRDLVFSFADNAGSDAAAKTMPLHLPATGRDFMLVFFPRADGKGPKYWLHAVELPADKFKGGSFAFLNYSNADIACVIDKEKSVISPSKAAILAPGKNEDIVPVACFEKEDGQWSERPFFSSRVPVQPKVRNLVLMSRDPRSGRIGFRAVADFVD